MFFPESLDNKSFRLFVQRTVLLYREKKSLSKTEQDIAYLIAEHPNIGRYFNQKFDVYENFKDDNNPYKILGALYQIYKQMSDDKPQGLRLLVKENFPSTYPEKQIRQLLADGYLELLKKEKLGKHFNNEIYLQEMNFYIKENFAQSKEDLKGKRSQSELAETDSYYNRSAINNSFNSLNRSFYKQMNEKDIVLPLSLVAAFKNLSSEWIEAISNFWKRPSFPAKYDRIMDLEKVFKSPEFINNVTKCLTSKEKQALQMLLDNEGYIKYGKMIKVFGDEESDNYWWTQQAPKSILGQLRYKGLVFAGRAKLTTNKYKIILIPYDLIPIIKNTLV